MINLPEITASLSASAEAIRAMLSAISPEQAAWSPDPETWSLLQVMTHIYSEERLDFRRHLKEVLAEPPLPWQVIRTEEIHPVADLQTGLADFLAERQTSIAWLNALPPVDWNRTIVASWGSLTAGDLLASWVEHDFLHIRQINEMRHAWNIHTAQPYQVFYAGDW